MLNNLLILEPPSRELHAVRTCSLGFSYCFPKALSCEPLLTRRNAAYVAQANYSLRVWATIAGIATNLSSK